MENSQPLDAGVRTELGKGPNRRLRAAGSIPAVVYGRGQEPIHIKVNPTAVSEQLDGPYGQNAIFKLNIAGSDASPTVRVKEVLRDPVKRYLKHVDFHAVDADSPITIQVPLKLDGVAVGIKQGGKLRQIRWTIKGVAKPADIPTHLSLDVTNLELGSMARVSEIDVPDGLKLVFADDFAVASVLAQRGALIEEEEEGEGEGEEEEA